MWVTPLCVLGSGATGRGTSIYPFCRKYFLEHIPYGEIGCSTWIEGVGLGPASSDVTDRVDSTLGALTLSGSQLKKR